MYTDRVRRRVRREKIELPEGYVLATDNDFSGTTNGSFRYIGTALKVVIPNKIKGISLTRYDNMFRDSNVIGVVSYNKNVTNMAGMFHSSKATILDLSDFDTSSVTSMRDMFSLSNATILDLSNFNTSNVTDMVGMFYSSRATSFDLSNFDTSNVTNMSYMFENSKATTGYARTQADADKFNASTNKPAGLNFIVKP